MALFFVPPESTRERSLARYVLRNWNFEVMTLSHNEAKAQATTRKEIDGLRAIAVLAVVLFHLGLGCKAGFVGVDVFFVISGFLITGIILRELDAGEFSLGRFWTRRIRRIFPALAALVAVTLVGSWWLLFPTQLTSVASQAMATLEGAANLKMRSILGCYWAPQANTVALLHTWSLSVEEQFYVGLPLLLILIHRWQRKQIGAILLVAMAGPYVGRGTWQRATAATIFTCCPRGRGNCSWAPWERP